MLADRIAGGLILALVAVYWFLIRSIHEVNIVSAMGPRIFPYLVAVVLAILGVSLFFVRDESHESWTRTEIRDTVVTVVAIILYALGVNALGYPIATAIFLIACLMYLAPDFTAKRWLTNGVIAVGFTLISYHLFTTGLGVLLPRGFYPF